MKNIYFIILTCILLFIIFDVYKIEYFEEKINKIIKDNNDFLKDPLFKDVVVYENDQNPYLSKSGLGLHKCFKDCKGTCVEIGVSGNTMCFN